MTQLPRIDRIKALLQDLSPKILEVKNQSHLHQGHAGDDGTGETHYLIKIQAKALDTLSRLNAHKKVMALLKTEFDSGLHALTLKILKKEKNE